MTMVAGSTRAAAGLTTGGIVATGLRLSRRKSFHFSSALAGEFCFCQLFYLSVFGYTSNMAEPKDKEAKIAKLEELEKRMAAADFWSDKGAAQSVIREIATLKDEIAGAEKYDK